MSKPLVIFIAIVVLIMLGLGLFLPEKQVNRIGQIHDNEGQQHLSSIDQEHAPYKTEPPTSGAHYTQPAAWGTSEDEIPDEQLVHNLEHGGVVITYQPNLPEKDVDKLRTIAATLTMRDDQTSNKGFKVVLAPRKVNKSAIQLSAWRYSLSLDNVDQGKIQQFYRDRPTSLAPELNAS